MRLGIQQHWWTSRQWHPVRKIFWSNAFLMANAKPDFVEIDQYHSSLWFRPIRQLLEHGKPPCPTTVLTFSPTPKGDLPFAALCCTRNGRLILWPALPKCIPMASEPSKSITTDHVTLELENGKSHATSYCPGGNAEHHRPNPWRIVDYPEHDLSYWLQFAIRRSVVEEQLPAVERRVPRTTNEHDRRISRQFSRYAELMTLQAVKLPSNDGGGDFYWVWLFLCTCDAGKVRLAPHLCPIGPLPEDVISGGPDNQQVMLQPTFARVGEVVLLVVTALPPGSLSEEIFGFSMRKPPAVSNVRSRGAETDG